jgi:hypothetical protein
VQCLVNIAALRLGLRAGALTDEAITGQGLSFTTHCAVRLHPAAQSVLDQHVGGALLLEVVVQ